MMMNISIYYVLARYAIRTIREGGRKDLCRRTETNSMKNISVYYRLASYAIRDNEGRGIGFV